MHRALKTVAAGLALGWVAWQVGLGQPTPPQEAPVGAPMEVLVAAPVVEPAATTPPAGDGGTPMAAPGAAAGLLPAASRCAYQELRLRSADGVVQACVAATRVSQSGDLRSLWLEPFGLDRWRLRVDIGEGRVMAAELVAPDGRRLGCEQEACTGWQAVDHDAPGRRRLVALDAPLAAAAATGRQQVVRLSATLSWPDDEADPALACGEAGIDAVFRDGARRRLCASAGLAVAREADGRRLYSLRNAEGQTLVVGIGASGDVDQLAWQRWRCDGAACSGAAVQTAAAGVPVLSVSGVTLAAGWPAGAGPASRGEDSVQLFGQLPLHEP